jgi:hypothetical protein
MRFREDPLDPFHLTLPSSDPRREAPDILARFAPLNPRSGRATLCGAHSADEGGASEASISGHLQRPKDTRVARLAALDCRLDGVSPHLGFMRSLEIRFLLCVLGGFARGSIPAHSGCFLHHLTRRLVLAQTQESRVPQQAVAGPFRETHLADELWLNPL